jgi:hypothetical protein
MPYLMTLSYDIGNIVQGNRSCEYTTQSSPFIVEGSMMKEAVNTGEIRDEQAGRQYLCESKAIEEQS